MRSSSNPAFRNLPTGGGYAGFSTATAGYAPSGASRAVERPMTVDDVVTKTGITLAVLLVTGAATWLTGAYWLALPGALIGFVLALVNIFKKKISPALVLAFAAAEGLLVGGISGYLNDMFGHSNIVLKAVAATAAVFGGMLVIYKTGVVRVTPRFRKWMLGALVGVVGLMIANLLASFFIPGGFELRTGGPLAIIFSLVVIGVAAFSFLLDFDMADRAIRAGAPDKTAWYIAFGLVLTLVWLYLEILRLLSYFQD